MPLLAVVLAMLVGVSGNLSFAAPPADAKARGQYNFYGRGARSAMRGAQESSQSYREYIRSAQPSPAEVVRESPPVTVLSPQVAQAAADEIGDYISKSEKHLAWMRRQAEVIDDKETLASLDSIDRNLAAAKRHHAILCKHCMQDAIDASAALECCQTIDDALSKAISEHDALMKRLGEKQPGEK